MYYRFKRISVDNYIAKHQLNNPKEDIQKLRNTLVRFRKLKNEGGKCNCGNPIWALGSAFTGNRCFTCITGETDASKDYEIE